MLYLAHTFAPQRESEAARDLLARLYSTTQGRPMPVLEKLPGGKPVFSQGELHCGIAHTRGHVFVALSDGPVGLDAEECTRPVSMKLARRILSPGEPADTPRQLLEYWVLKEAYTKFTGEGLRQSFRALTFDRETLRLEGSDLRFTLQELFGCLVALCTRQEEPPRLMG